MLSPSVVIAVDLAVAYQDCSQSGAPIVPGTRTDLRRAFEQCMKVGSCKQMAQFAYNQII